MELVDWENIHGGRIRGMFQTGTVSFFVSVEIGSEFVGG